MDRAHIWPDFRAEWVVHEDADILVVDKPVGVSSQAADAERPDDIVTRLKRFVAPSGGRREDGYMGVHQRLDRDTSGLLVFARRREANAQLAAQFEQRTVGKTYIACVTGWPSGRERATLRDAVAPGQGGKMNVVGPRDRAGKEATTHVHVMARRGDRAMLRLELDSGRTHQARVQLAHARAPIGGDTIYGGAPAPRLMLHASVLALTHPISGRRMRFEAPMPPEFDRWLAHADSGEAIYDDDVALARAIDRAIERRWGLGRSDCASRPATRTTAFRLVNEEGDGLPRLAVDAYDGWLVAQLYADDGGGVWADLQRRERLLDRLASLGFDGVYLKIRPKQANLLVDTRRAEIAPSAPVRGAAAPYELAVIEEGTPLLVRLGDGLSTGLFLDQRANRGRVRNIAAGLSVLNLFSYTCAFTVAAALGGARRTVSVDASVVALTRGRDNLSNAVNAGALEGGTHSFVADDVFAWLARASRHRERFDLVVLDPPSYSTTRRGRFVADVDYSALAAAALAVLAPRGRLLACTNHRGISPSRFRRILFDGGRSANRQVAQVKDLPPPSDFPVPPGGDPHTKSVLLTLSD
jgi:23S rRNA (cytosine1962-C5)-methyltransferase